MIGLTLIAIIVGYIFLARFAVSKIYVYTGEKIAKNVALAIFILIPTWDIIIGLPVYAYLCTFESGMKIYKTVDNVEGFYVGEKGIEHQPHEPYDGYRYVDYKETRYGKSTGKYYRSYWVNYWKDTNASSLCVPPSQKYKFNDYNKAYKQGKCIVKKEISESEVSGWEWIDDYKVVSKLYILNIEVTRLHHFGNRLTKEIIAENYSVWWHGGWFYGFLSSIPTGRGGTRCSGSVNYNNFMQSILKPANGVSHVKN